MRSSTDHIEKLCKNGVIKAFHKESHHVLFCKNDSGVTVIELRDPSSLGLVSRVDTNDEDRTLISMFKKVRKGFKSKA